jgi:hypothetical protein
MQIFNSRNLQIDGEEKVTAIHSAVRMRPQDIEIKGMHGQVAYFT